MHAENLDKPNFFIDVMIFLVPSDIIVVGAVLRMGIRMWENKFCFRFLHVV